jgi:hypothetical protein
MREIVILSAAKNLGVENRGAEILRCALDDIDAG